MGGSVMAVVINGTTGIDKVQDGSIGTADIAADAITTPKIANSVNLGRRNLIINGAMQVAQRGTSVTGVTGTGASSGTNAISDVLTNSTINPITIKYYYTFKFRKFNRA